MDAGASAVDRKELRLFGLVLAAFAGLAFGLIVPWRWDLRWPLWPWVVALVLVVLALAAPMLLRPIQRAWLAVGYCMNWIFSRAALVFTYYAVVLPIAAAKRLLTRDPIGRHFDRRVTTYRVPSERVDRKHMERPF